MDWETINNINMNIFDIINNIPNELYYEYNIIPTINDYTILYNTEPSNIYNEFWLADSELYDDDDEISEEQYTRIMEFLLLFSR
jgi:hypothetical protein